MRPVLREGATVFAIDLAEQGHLADPDSDSSKFIRLDVTSEEEVRGAMASVDAQCGKLDVLVNAAGSNSKKPLKTPRWKNGTVVLPSM